jgi:hypothetical protein
VRFIGNEALDNVSPRFGGRAEVGWALGPAHLKRGWHNNADGVARRVGHDVSEVPLLVFLDKHAPKAIRQVDLEEHHYFVCLR